MARIVAAEDQQDIQDLLRLILERAGHTVIVVGDGGEVRIAIDEHSPDLVLLDVGLPTMNGLDVCRALRQAPTTAKLPVGIISGQVTPPFVTELAAGADAVLPKPFTRQSLTHFVDQLLRHDLPTPPVA